MSPDSAFGHVAPFGALIGTWHLAAHTSPHWQGTLAGEASFEWFDEQAFVIQHVRLPQPFPRGLYVIGGREGGDHPGSGSGATLAHYFDSRSVVRIYTTSLVDGVWIVWRDAPGFDQRFVGRLSEDGSRITGTWEMRNDADWFVDFHLDYVRTG